MGQLAFENRWFDLPLSKVHAEKGEQQNGQHLARDCYSHCFRYFARLAPLERLRITKQR